jgi:flagellar motility protein MotE (MotC chaperone)
MKSSLSIRSTLIVSLLVLLPILLPITLGASDLKTEEAQKPSPGVQRRILKSSCLSEEAVLEDIKKAREEIEVKRKSLEAKETELKSRESILEEQLKKLEATRDEIAKIQVKQGKEAEEKVDRLVETVLTMSPKSAAKLLASLDDQLAVSTMSKMDTLRLGKILNVMDPNRSSRLSEMMAGVVRANKEPVHSRAGLPVSNDTSGTISFSKKGGEKNNAQSELQDNKHRRSNEGISNSIPEKEIQPK